MKQWWTWLAAAGLTSSALTVSASQQPSAADRQRLRLHGARRVVAAAARNSTYRVRVKIPGIRPPLAPKTATLTKEER